MAKGKSVFLEQMKKFVEWLKNAEEGKSSSVDCLEIGCSVWFVLSFQTKLHGVALMALKLLLFLCLYLPAAKLQVQCTCWISVQGGAERLTRVSFFPSPLCVRGGFCSLYYPGLSLSAKRGNQTLTIVIFFKILLYLYLVYVYECGRHVWEQISFCRDQIGARSYHGVLH